MDYQVLRTLSDSWGLVYLVVVFIGVVIWAFRPGAKDAHEAAARIPLKKD